MKIKNFIISSIKKYSDTYFSEDINLIDNIVFDKYKCINIFLEGDDRIEIVLKVSDKSLNKISENLFGNIMEDENIRSDLAKEMLNIIAGNILLNVNKEYRLSLPELCNKDYHNTNELFFKNSILEISIFFKKNL